MRLFENPVAFRARIFELGRLSFAQHKREFFGQQRFEEHGLQTGAGAGVVETVGSVMGAVVGDPDYRRVVAAVRNLDGDVTAGCEFGGRRLEDAVWLRNVFQDVYEGDEVELFFDLGHVSGVQRGEAWNADQVFLVAAVEFHAGQLPLWGRGRPGTKKTAVGAADVQEPAAGRHLDVLLQQGREFYGAALRSLRLGKYLLLRAVALVIDVVVAINVVAVALPLYGGRTLDRATLGAQGQFTARPGGGGIGSHPLEVFECFSQLEPGGTAMMAMVRFAVHQQIALATLAFRPGRKVLVIGS